MSKPMFREWLEVDDIKNRMFYQSDDGYIYYVMFQGKQGILYQKEVAFFQVIIPPTMHKIGNRKYPVRTMRVSVAYYDKDTQKWEADHEVLPLRLTQKSYSFLSKKELKCGDRICAKCYLYKRPFDGKTMRGISWELSKRGD